jgi:hypothetical protein
MAKGDRLAPCERGRIRYEMHHLPEPSGCCYLESGLRSKDSRAVRRGAVGKVPIEATRWRPTLLLVRFGEGFSKTAWCEPSMAC